MKIETKYNIGDGVHLIHPYANIPAYKYVHEIRVRYYGTKSRIYYYLVAGIGMDVEVAEDRLLPTKEELIKSRCGK